MLLNFHFENHDPKIQAGTSESEFLKKVTADDLLCGDFLKVSYNQSIHSVEACQATELEVMDSKS